MSQVCRRLRNPMLAVLLLVGSGLSGNVCRADGPGVQARVTGWVSGISAADGVITGWAVDTQNTEAAVTLAVYANQPPAQGGTPIPLSPVPLANGVNHQLGYQLGYPGSHNFSIPIPPQFRSPAISHYYVVATAADGKESQLLPGSNQWTYRSRAGTTTMQTSTRCLPPASTCTSLAVDYGSPNYPQATGWSDGKDYFRAWGCSSSVGLRHIARLNIIPHGGPAGTQYHDENFQLDSLSVNGVDQLFGAPVVYFTSSRYNEFSSVFALKKAAFNAQGSGNWEVFDVLDYPSNAGGLSSQDGRYPAIIMNDYSQPGFGPTSPYSGSTGYLPGVSTVAANPEGNSFPLVGRGPHGLTEIVNLLQGPGWTSGDVEGRTCLHLNPKLFDYNAAGVPQSMIAYLYQESYPPAPDSPPGTPPRWRPCKLPDGTTLPTIGYYVYHYDAKSGWQLDTTFGPVESPSAVPSANQDQAMKLMFNAGNHSFIAGNWQGEITTINLDDPAPRSKTVIMSCRNPGLHFGEATGSTSQVWFLANPPGSTAYRKTPPFPASIYYAYR